ncbi:hypothetical protein, partial [Sansalvadorimonas verongulae]|uniref:hypothetical protein n=1 Tax=Sansalvadorimonas verongulae TaxID=2172824 RepID=UPI0018AD257F
ILDVLKQPVAGYCQDEPEESMQAQLPQPVITTLDSRTNYEQLPAQQAPVITTLDSRTNYEQLPAPCVSYKKVFQTVDHDPRMTRLYVYNIAATPEGGLMSIELGRGEYGLEAVLPGTLSASDPIPLARNHHYAQTSLAWERNQWFFLPGMTPDETIIAMCTEPEKACSVMKDRYSGLHMVFIPKAQPGEEIIVHYIVETRDKTENTNKTENVLVYKRPDATCSKYMSKEIDRLFTPESLAGLPKEQQEELL